MNRFNTGAAAPQSGGERTSKEATHGKRVHFRRLKNCGVGLMSTVNRNRERFLSLITSDMTQGYLELLAFFLLLVLLLSGVIWTGTYRP